MNKNKILLSLFAFLAIVSISGTAMADSITPDTVSATIDVGQSVTISKTVTIDTAAPTSAKVDVLFLFDTTGSMAGTLDSAKANAATILASTSGLGDVAFGVARYEDFPVLPYGYPAGDPYGWGLRADTPFQLVQDMSTNSALSNTAINSLSTNDGEDTPESNLYALSHASTDVTWRADSTRIILWFGDSPGHDGTLEAGYPSGIGLSDTISALTAQNITVEAVNVGWGGLDSTGQATAITDATDGDVFANPDPSDLADIIDAAIISVFQTYHTVTLDTSSVPSGLTASVVPVSYTGVYDRSVARTFSFDLTLTGDTPGTYSFDVRALVDGGIVATEADTITVGGTPPVPEPSTMMLLGTGLFSLAGFRRKFKK